MNKVIGKYCKILIITYFLFGSFAISSIENVNSTNHFDDIKTFFANILLSATDQVSRVGVPDLEEWILLLAGLGLICVQILNNSRNS